MTLRDELMKMVEAAGKVAPGPWRATDYTVEKAGTKGISAPAWEMFLISPGVISDDEAEHFAMCSPERIKALAEVALAAEAITIGGKGLTQKLAELSELWAALERLGKAVGT